MSLLDRLLGRGGKEAKPKALAVVRNVTVGRTVVVDPLAWRRLGPGAAFSLDRDTLEITAQGLVKLDAGGWVHRFYTDDHIMLQMVSDDPEGMLANDFTVFAPWSSRYPDNATAKAEWLSRLGAPTFKEPGLPAFDRFWFAEEPGRQAPVTFWEDIFDDREAREPYARIFQRCMLFAREIGDEGRELLLAIAQETEGGELSHEIMVGAPLGVAEFRA